LSFIRCVISSLVSAEKSKFCVQFDNGRVNSGYLINNGFVLANY